MRRAADLWPFRFIAERVATAVAVGAFALVTSASPSRADAVKPVLRVCADPDNMPFSNAQGKGFENALAALVATQLGKRLDYTWTGSERASAGQALEADKCDVVIGVPIQLDRIATTQPYYWSSYVLISRTDRNLDISSLKDHRLRQMKIGVASVGGDQMFSPPAHALAQAGLADRLVGYPIDGESGSTERRARIVEAVAKGDIELAAVWGPLAGYFIQRSPVPLTAAPIGDTDEFSARKTHFELLALQYEIAMGVRPGNDALHRDLDRVIVQRRADIDALLRRYGVPLIEPDRLAAAAPADTAD